MQPEDVRLRVVFHGAQLHTGHHPHAELCTRGLGFADPVEGVVIGEGDCRQPDPLGLDDDVTRRARSVGRGGVGMQIDEGCGAVANGRCPRHFA